MIHRTRIKPERSSRKVRRKLRLTGRLLVGPAPDRTPDRSCGRIVRHDLEEWCGDGSGITMAGHIQHDPGYRSDLKGLSVWGSPSPYMSISSRHSWWKTEQLLALASAIILAISRSSTP